MKRLEDYERSAVELVHSLPINTVIVLGNIDGACYHQVLRRDEIKRAPSEAAQLASLYDHDPEDDK